MNTEQASGKLTQLSGKIKEKWGRLTDDDVALYNGQQEQFFGKLKEKHGLAKEDAEKQIKEMQRNADRAA